MKILHYLPEDPRNFAKVSRLAKLPYETTRSRLIRLIKEEGVLKITANVDYYKLGLSLYTVIASARFSLISEVRKLLKTKYTLTITRCYSGCNGYVVDYCFPIGREEILLSYLSKLRESEVFSRLLIFKRTPLKINRINFLKYYDLNNHSWRTSFSEWAEEVISAPISSEKVPFEGPKIAIFDPTDLIILRELEVDGTTDFVALAKIVGITPQGIRYHYYRHIVGKELIDGYDISIYTYPPPLTISYAGIFSFNGFDNLCRFINATYGKPFVHAYAKIFGENKLLTHLRILSTDLPEFFEALDYLCEKRVIQGYFLAQLNEQKSTKYTDPYHNFSNGVWRIDEADFMDKIEKARSLTGVRFI
ncbi:MAG TPA: hypothetical protein ENF55_04310 [Thermoprotei archaeon]|nr:hypothetical protein [Thermoprotei archaeon]